MDDLALTYRMMTAEDVGRIPIAHMGTADEVTARIAALGSSAVLVFDGDRHVGQLQFRAHEPGLRSPNGLWDPLYWMDFGTHEPNVPDGSLTVCCYHVGQLDESEERAARYLGRGIGLRLLDELLAWARRRDVPAVVAKATPPQRPVMGFMGGQPAPAYEARGFTTTASWVDDQLAEVVVERGLADEADLPGAATVGCCVLELR
jgi:hypothetical protein